MSAVISFTVYGNAAPGGSKTAGRTKDGRMFVRDSNNTVKQSKQEIKQAAAPHFHGLMEGPIALDVTFYRPRPKGHFGRKGNVLPSAPPYPTTKPDATKLLRAVEDALTGVAWRDDAQIVIQRVMKLYDEPARIDVQIMPVPDDRGVFHA